MDLRMVQLFGPRFVVDDIRDLELLTDLLSISHDHLNVMFAVASYLEQVPNGINNLKPMLRERLRQSLRQLARHGENSAPYVSYSPFGSSIGSAVNSPDVL